MSLSTGSRPWGEFQFPLLAEKGVHSSRALLLFPPLIFYGDCVFLTFFSSYQLAIHSRRVLRMSFWPPVLLECERKGPPSTKAQTQNGVRPEMINFFPSSPAFRLVDRKELQISLLPILPR